MHSASRLKKLRNRKTALIIVITIALTLNIMTFAFAYPEMYKPASPELARDFSAYYIGAWRLFHNPTKVYVGGSQPGDYLLSQRPQTFKYAPSFLFLIAPFLALDYQDAFIAFNVIQLILMFALAFFVYKLTRDKSLALAATASVIILIAPLPALPLIQNSSQLASRLSSLNPQTFSWSYYWGWVCGQAHILQTIILTGATYFGAVKKTWLSALLLALGSFDPRFALLALPLIAWYNRQHLRAFLAGTALFLAAMNLPFFLYQNVGFAFLRATVSGEIVSQMYAYDWIPLYSVLALSLVEIFTLVNKRGNIQINQKRATNKQALASNYTRGKQDER